MRIQLRHCVKSAIQENGVPDWGRRSRGWIFRGGGKLLVSAEFRGRRGPNLAKNSRLSARFDLPIIGIDAEEFIQCFPRDVQSVQRQSDFFGT